MPLSFFVRFQCTFSNASLSFRLFSMRLNFFCDIDGTLLPFGKTVPGSAVEAIEKARLEGHRFFLSTGRSECEIDECLKSIPFDGGAYSNGATVVADSRVLRKVRMTDDDRSFIISYAEKNGLLFMFQTDEGTFLSHEAAAFFKESLMKAIGTVIPVPSTIEYDRLPESLPDVIKAIYFSPSHDLMRVRKELGGRFQMVDNTDALPQTDMVEVCLPGLDKGTGVRDMISALGEDMSSSVAIGDGANDIPMLKAAALGIAMGNGSEDAKKSADWITAKVDDDGFRKAVEYAVKTMHSVHI